jgi:PAS domain S-box-containing protein
MPDGKESRVSEPNVKLEGLTKWVNDLPVAAILADTDGVTLASNRAAQKLFGRAASTGSTTIGKQRWFKSLAAGVRSGQTSQTIKLSNRTRPGRSRIKLTAITMDRVGRPMVLMLVAVRPGELRADEQYRILLDNLLEPVAVHRDGVVIYANVQLAGLIGADSPESLIGTSVLERVHPDYHGIVMQRIAASRSGEPLETVEVKVVTRDGTILDVEVRSTSVCFNGEPATQLIMRDITSRKVMEAGLEASQQQYRVLTESVREYAIVSLDRNGMMTSWNSGAEHITGYSADDCVGAQLGIILSFDEAAREAAVQGMLDTAVSQGRLETELWARHKERGDYWASVTITAMQDPDGTVVGYTAVLHDLSRQREIESRLRKSEEQLRQAQKMDAIGRLAAGIAHDFKNLITAIHGHAQFLLEDLPHTSDLRTDVVEIKRAADRAAELTRQLLTFARKQDIEARPLDVNDIIRTLEKMLRRLIRADLELNTHLSSGLPTIMADRGQIEQVIMNLVVNARDAIPGDGAISIMTSSLDLDERYTAGGLDLDPGKYVLIGVTDTGIGMDQETQRHIFEPFFTTKREGEGTGLGLATVYGIVRRFGGHVSIYSEPGKGSTIKVFLPVSASAVPSAARDAAAAGTNGRANGDTNGHANGHASETVLLVEDNAAIRSLATRILRSRGYPVLAAENGDAAIAAVEAHEGKIDLLLTDLMMPGLSGEDLAVQIRRMCPGIAVMFMSGFSEQSQGDVARTHDATFLEKPFAPDELARRVADVLNQRRH